MELSSLARNYIYHGVVQELERSGLATSVRLLQHSLPLYTPIYVVGGLARDCTRAYLTERRIPSKDADIVVDTNHLDNTMKVVARNFVHTALGGYRWTPASDCNWIDVWQLRDTIWIKELGLKPTVELFLNGVDLNIDRIAVGLHDGVVLERGCRSGIEARFIDIDACVQSKELVDDELARAIMAHCKTGYSLSTDVIGKLERADRQTLRQRASQRLIADGYSTSSIAPVLGLISAHHGTAGAAC